MITPYIPHALNLSQPYQDPYTSPKPDRIIREIQGNGPVENVSSPDIQCGGWTAGGIVGSQPAKLHAGPVAAGSTVTLKWTLWPDSHKGPLITYMAKCPNNDCTTWMPGTAYVLLHFLAFFSFFHWLTLLQRRVVQGSPRRPRRHIQRLGFNPS